MFKKVCLIFVLFTAVHAQADDYLLFFMGGQSNMEGYGFSKDLSDEYIGPVNDVMLFFGNPVADDAKNGGKGIWSNLMPGYGVGAKSTEHSLVLSNRFGPELSFGKRLSQLTNRKIAIIKYARGGSSIALGASAFGTWGQEYAQNTRINQWDHFNDTVRSALAYKDIDADGEADTLTPAGIIWMQGESDAYDKTAAQAYYQNLTSLMNDMAIALGDKDIPIILGRIEDSGKTPKTRMMPYIETVWKAQRKFAKEQQHAQLVSFPEPVEFISDKWHYKSKHYIQLGNMFAETAAQSLINQPTEKP